jgi:MoaA/NifB/PqqE/SkfB family radical SAM enzyme
MRSGGDQENRYEFLDEELRKRLNAFAPVALRWAEGRQDWRALLPPAPNGADHVRNVLTNALEIVAGRRLTPAEREILVKAVLLHDLGKNPYWIGRLGGEWADKNHADASYEIVRRFHNEIGLGADEATQIAIVCAGHGHPQDEMRPKYEDHSRAARLWLVGPVLRLADEVDNSLTRYGAWISSVGTARSEINKVEFDHAEGQVIYHHQAEGIEPGHVRPEVKVGFYHIWASTVRALDDTHDLLKRAGIDLDVARFHPELDILSFCHEAMDTGVVAFLRDRKTLEEYLPIERVLEMAKPGSRLLIIARTAIRWSPQLAGLHDRITEAKLQVCIGIGTIQSAQRIAPWVGQDARTTVDTLRNLKEDFPELRVEARVLPDAVQQGICITETKTGQYIATLDAPIWRKDDRSSFVLDLSSPGLADIRKHYEAQWDGGVPLEQYIEDLDRTKKILDTQRAHEELSPSLTANEAWRALPYLIGCQERRLPLCIQVELTNACNSHCIMCHRWQAESALSNHMPLPLWKGLIDDISRGPDAAIGYAPPTLSLSGGEPTLHPQFREMSQYAAEQGLHAGLYTNGSRLTDKDAHWCATCFEWIRFSLDALSPEVHQRLRGFDRSILPRIIGLCRRLHLAASVPTTRLRRIGVSYAIQRDNTEELSDMFRGRGEAYENLFKLAEYGVRVYFKFPNRQNLVNEAPYLLEEASVQSFLDAARNGLENIPVLAVATNLRYIVDKFDIGRYTTRDVADGHPLQTWLGKHRPKCYVPNFFAVVDFLGRCFPCCYQAGDNAAPDGRWHAHRSEISLGSISLHTPFWRVWNGPDWRRWQPEREGVCGWCTRFAEYNVVLDKCSGAMGTWEAPLTEPVHLWL